MPTGSIEYEFIRLRCFDYIGNLSPLNLKTFHIQRHDDLLQKYNHRFAYKGVPVPDYSSTSVKTVMNVDHGNLIVADTKASSSPGCSRDSDNR
jgi:hypothetical protein